MLMNPYMIVERAKRRLDPQTQSVQAAWPNPKTKPITTNINSGYAESQQQVRARIMYCSSTRRDHPKVINTGYIACYHVMLGGRALMLQQVLQQIIYK